CQQVYNPPFTF
nr:immunoglobulin light chain junction region [Macaca mulatta]